MTSDRNRVVAELQDAPPSEPGANSTAAIQVCEWLVTMDDPGNDDAMSERRTITMTKIIERARAALAAEVSGGTSTGSARPPQPDLSASEGERLRHLAEQIISPDALVVGGESEALARGVLRLLARVVLLEEALRAARQWVENDRLDALDRWGVWPRSIAVEAVEEMLALIDAALVGDASPEPRAPITGSGIDF